LPGRPQRQPLFAAGCAAHLVGALRRGQQPDLRWPAGRASQHRRPDRPRARGAGIARARLHQPRDRRAAVPGGGDGQEPRPPYPLQARPPGSPGRRQLLPHSPTLHPLAEGSGAPNAVAVASLRACLISAVNGGCMNWYPEPKPVPASLETEDLQLEMLAPEHVDLDYDALMSSRERLMRWSGGRWPHADFTRAENLDDMVMHRDEFLAREAFTYTVLNRARDRCEGCVYIYPLARTEEEAGRLPAGLPA